MTQCLYCNDPAWTSIENYRCYICDPKRPEEFIYPAEEAESAATEEVMKHYPTGLTEFPGVLSWAFTKNRIPNAIVTVTDPDDKRYLLTYAGDAMLHNRLFFTKFAKFTQQRFNGIGTIAQLRFDRDCLLLFSVRLDNQGLRMVKA